MAPLPDGGVRQRREERSGMSRSRNIYRIPLGFVLILALFFAAVAAAAYWYLRRSPVRAAELVIASVKGLEAAEIEETPAANAAAPADESVPVAEVPEAGEAAGAAETPVPDGGDSGTDAPLSDDK